MNGLYSIELSADQHDDTRALMAAAYAEDLARARALHALLTRGGISSAAGYHYHFVSVLVRREITSFTDLAPAEIAKVERAVAELVAGRAARAAYAQAAD